MSEEQQRRMCVFLPAREGQVWAVPQNCLGEIVTLQDAETAPPPAITWRGQRVPVIDFGGPDGPRWRDEKTVSGLIAVFLGIREQACDYWGLALRGPGLGVRRLEDAACTDRPEACGEYALAAFEFEGRLYQVPDLPALQAFACEVGRAATA